MYSCLDCNGHPIRIGERVQIIHGPGGVMLSFGVITEFSSTNGCFFVPEGSTLGIYKFPSNLKVAIDPDLVLSEGL